jgi:hypothetical protein
MGMLSLTRAPDLSVPVVNELEKLSGEITWYEQQAQNSARLTLQYKLEIGKRLMRAKGILPHGHFLSWARQQFGWTPRHVQNHLLLADNAKRISHLPTGASMRLALASIRKEDPGNGSPAKILPEIEPVQRIYLIGEIPEGRLDPDLFSEALKDLANEFGAPNTRWRARLAVCEKPGRNDIRGPRRTKQLADGKERSIEE